MKVQFNTDNHITGTEELEAFVTEKINTSLERFSDRITRVEVHLSDQNAHKGGADDIQCKLEVRLEGMKPVTVVSKSNAKEKALTEAISKVKSALNSAIGKMRDK